MRPFRNLKLLSRVLILALLHFCWLTSTGWAEMIPTESTVQSAEDSPEQTDRQRLFDLLNHERVQKTLHQYGISREEAKDRINSLSDQELKAIAGKLDRLQAGGHDPYGYDDDDDDWELELALIILLIGVIAVAYFLGLLAKAIMCPFFEDCDAAFLFRPWWVGGPPPDVQPDPRYQEGTVETNQVNPPEPPDPSETSPREIQSPGRGAYVPGGECDAREQACEWTVR